MAIEAWPPINGSATSSITGAVTIVAAQGVGFRLYVGGLQFSNSSATGTLVTLSDTASSEFFIPALSCINLSFPTPLIVPPNSPLTFTPASGTTTLFANAQTFRGVV